MNLDKKNGFHFILTSEKKSIWAKLILCALISPFQTKVTEDKVRLSYVRSDSETLKYDKTRTGYMKNHTEIMEL